MVDNVTNNNTSHLCSVYLCKDGYQVVNQSEHTT